MTHIKGLVVLITGGASGIGAATARALKTQGAVPVLVDCDAQQLAVTAADIGVASFCADVTNFAACEAAVVHTLNLYGRLNVVWANAGIASFGPLRLTDMDAWRRCVDVNVFGTLNIVRAALPFVIDQRGYVLATASVSSFAHPPCVSSYAASKAAVEAMCNSWRIELASHGVAVGTIYASWVQTKMLTEGDMHPAFVRLKSTMPAVMSRAMPAQQAADMILRGIERRARRIWVPGWVRVLHWLRAALNTPGAERPLLKAAPDMERLFLQTIATSGVKASSVAPRELNRKPQDTSVAIK